MKKIGIGLMLSRKMDQYVSMLEAYFMYLFVKFSFVSTGLKIPTGLFIITPYKTFVMEKQSPSVYSLIVLFYINIKEQVAITYRYFPESSKSRDKNLSFYSKFISNTNKNLENFTSSYSKINQKKSKKVI